MPESAIAPGLAGGNALRRPAYAGWVALFVGSFALYGATANRGVQWQDSGSFIVQIMSGQLVSPLGLALTHPLHHWLGRLALLPGGLEPCVAITLVSSLAAALAVASVYGCVRTLTGSGWAALFAAASLGLANTFWHLATITEVYTVNAALLAGECWCLVAYARRRSKYALWGMLLLNGLGLANHLQAVLTTPVLAAVIIHALVRRHLTGGRAAVGCLLWLVGSLPYTGLVIRELVRTGNFLATMQSTLFGKYYAASVLNAIPAPRVVLVSVCFLILNFPNLLLLGAGYGLACCWRSDGSPRARSGLRAGRSLLAVRALGAGLVLHAIFVLRYNVIDQHTFFLPLYVLLAVFGGVGAASVLRWPRRRRRKVSVAGVLLLLLTPVAYLLILVFAREHHLLSGAIRNKPYRDDYVYLLVPWSVVERSAERMSSEAVELAGRRGLIVVEDPMARFAVYYQRLRADLSELEITMVPGPEQAGKAAALADQIGQAAADGRPVVLVPLDADRPATEPPVGAWRRVRDGDLYLLEAPAAKAPIQP